MGHEVRPGHWLVLGQTGAGKSSYLRHVAIPSCFELGEDGKPEQVRGCAVFDPFGEEWPEGVWATSDRMKFHEKVWKENDWLVIHDEVSEVGKNDRALERLAVQGRHLDHTCIFSAQRPQLISTTVRGQTTNLVSFHLVPKDAEFLVDEYGDERLDLVSKLPPLHYIVADRWGNISRDKITFPKDAPKT